MQHNMCTDTHIDALQTHGWSSQGVNSGATGVFRAICGLPRDSDITTLVVFKACPCFRMIASS
jgi:hypothetical protein